MSITVTTGKSVILDDGQMQTEVILSGDVIYRDHLSHSGDAANLAPLAARIEALIAKLTKKAQPPQLIAPGTVIDLTPVVIVPPKPTADDAARIAWTARLIAAQQAELLTRLTPFDGALASDYAPSWGVI